jgi:Ser/Thr protein kinase RdoA (MazF antagonist)
MDVQVHQWFEAVDENVCYEDGFDVGNHFVTILDFGAAMSVPAAAFSYFISSAFNFSKHLPSRMYNHRVLELTRMLGRLHPGLVEASLKPTFFRRNNPVFQAETSENAPFRGKKVSQKGANALFWNSVFGAMPHKNSNPRPE